MKYTPWVMHTQKKIGRKRFFIFEGLDYFHIFPPVPLLPILR